LAESALERLRCDVGEPEFSEVMSALNVIRSNGYGEIHGYPRGRTELNHSIGLAIPIFDASGCAVATVGTTAAEEEWIPDNIWTFLQSLRNCSRVVSERLGYRRPKEPPGIP
jgi:DNA-binding IclR family transcriptional regulator